MRRILTAVFLAFFALGLASPAVADKGDKWRERDRGGDHRDRGDDGGRRDNGKRDGGGRGWGNGDRRYNNDNDRNDGQRYQNRRRDDDRPPWFGRRREHDRAREGVMRGRMIPLEDLENRIQRRAPGYRIGNPEFMMFGGRPVYRIRWRTPDGHVLIVFADAETGQIIDIRGR